MGERLGGDGDEVHLVDPGGQRSVQASLVEHEADVRHRRAVRRGPRYCRHDLLRTRHLRHPARMHEAHRLQAPYPGRDESTDQLHPGVDVEHPGLVLQAVTRPDLDDMDTGGRCGHDSSLPPPLHVCNN